MTGFAGLQSALSALRAAQRGLDVTGLNLAGAATPGYVRRRVDQASVGPAAGVPTLTMPPASGPGGVTTSTNRLADPVLDARARIELGSAAAASGAAAAYATLETTFNEPSDTGLAAQLDNLWNAFGQVAAGGSAAGVLGAAGSVTDWLHQASAALDAQSQDAGATLAQSVGSAATLAQQLADVNGSIASATAAGQDTSDLADLRDGITDQLATLVGARTTLQPDGSALVTVGGSTLVSGRTAGALAVGSDGASVTLDGNAVTPESGTAAAAITTMTSTVPTYRSMLDGVAAQLVTTLSSAGRTAGGQPTSLLTGTGAADIQLAVTGPADATTSTPGSVNTAVAAGLSQEGLAPDSPDAGYRTMIATLGADSGRAQATAQTRAAASSAVLSARLSSEGVSTDEELTNLLTYQRSYEAASRVMTTMDSVLDTLINRTGTG